MTQPSLNQPVTKQAPLPTSSSTGQRTIFAAWNGEEIPDNLMDACAALFSNNYGIWGSKIPQRKGKRVKMTPTRLRAQCFSNPKQTVLATCFMQNKLVGHAFATVWDTEVASVGWVTQLVVDKEVRRRGIATQLLQTFKLSALFTKVTAVGLVSSHPATCTVLAKYANAKIGSIDFTFCRNNAQKIIDGSPIDYVQKMQLRGSLFEEGCTSGAISTANTEFYLDHKEPQVALQVFKNDGRWCLGELLDGHEFLIILPV